IIVRHFWELLPKIKQLANFYERGKLIAFYMDICMLRQSAYTESLRELMLGLLTKYHKGVPFKDEEILYEIGKLAPAGTADILKRFVIGSERLPYADIFAAVGYNWVEKGCMAYSFGKVRMYYNAKAGKYKITANTNNCLNLQKGDLILKIDGQDFNPSTFRNLYISRIMIPENRQLTVDILRNGKAVALTGTPCKDRKLKRSWVLSDDQADKSAA
ncbi:MAG: hypothetical protein ACE5DN_08040, partial [Flavobacteriales bacterium]